MLLIAFLITLCLTSLCVVGEKLWDLSLEVILLPVPKIVWVVDESPISTLQRSRQIHASINKFPAMPKNSVLLR